MKNSTERFNSTFKLAEEVISEIEDRTLEIIQFEE